MFADARTHPDRCDAEFRDRHPRSSVSSYVAPLLAVSVSVDYTRLAADYDAVRVDEATDRTFWLPALRDVGRLTAGERILDLGAGTGRYARLLAEFARVVALDRSPDMLARAREKGGFDSVRGDAHRLPFQNGSFDATVAVMVLHQIPDYPDVLREVARVSRRIAIAAAGFPARSPRLLVG